jgi:hypothetical protein
VKSLLNHPIIKALIQYQVKFALSWVLLYLIQHYTFKASVMTGHKIMIPDFVIAPMVVGLTFITRLVWQYIIKPAIILLGVAWGTLGATNLIPKDSHFYFLHTPKNLLILVVCALLVVGSLFALWSIFRRFKRPAFYKTIEQIDNFGRNRFGKIINTKLGGTLFEEYVVSLYRAMGYEAATIAELKALGKVKTKGVDQGADILVKFVENGNARKVIIQCKHYQNSVGNSAVQEAYTAINMYGCDQAVVITNNYYTPAAIELAQKNNVILIDRDQLIVLNEKTFAKKKTTDLDGLMEKVRSAA